MCRLFCWQLEVNCDRTTDQFVLQAKPIPVFQAPAITRLCESHSNCNIRYQNLGVGMAVELTVKAMVTTGKSWL